MLNNLNELFQTIPDIRSNILDNQNCSQNLFEDEKQTQNQQFKCSLLEIPELGDQSAFLSFFRNNEDPQMSEFFKKQRNSAINFSNNSIFNFDSVYKPANPIFRQNTGETPDAVNDSENLAIFQNLWTSKRNIFENEQQVDFPLISPKQIRQANLSVKKDNTKKDRVSCHCKKSKCLRLYCECFAKGLICGIDCDCSGCGNHEDLKELRELVVQETLDKNPFAFKSKYKTLKEDETLLHSRGCNCSKTGCVKKYCECFNAGTGCSRLCKCSNCKNENIELKDSDVKLYYDRVLRKRSKKSVLNWSTQDKTDLFAKIKQL